MERNILSFFVKKAAIILLFFTITPLTIFASVVSLISTTSQIEANKNTTSTQSTGTHKTQVFSGVNITSEFPSLSVEVVPEDGRGIIIKNYLERQNSPLAPYAFEIVEVSDKYGLDYKLLPAIAQKESGLCRVIPEGSHNCWGWGIHSKGTLKFDSYSEALEVVAKGLRENYIDKGYVTPEQIMKKYAHPDSTTWADGVSLYMEQLE